MNRQNELSKFWLILSDFYQKELSDTQIKINAKDCEDFSLEDLEWAWEMYRKEDMRGFIPTPAKLLSYLEPKLPEEQQAEEMAGNILKAIRYCGMYREPFQPGSLERWVIDSAGGWQSICCDDIENLGTLRAQLRRLSLVAIEKNINKKRELKLVENRDNLEKAKKITQKVFKEIE